MKQNRTSFGLNLFLGALLLLVNVFLFNALMDRVRVGRVDLTEGGYYSLSEPVKQIMADLEEPGVITFYYSSIETQHEKLRPLIDPLKDLLSEFASASNGKVQVRFSVLDKAGKAEQDIAENSFGVRPNSIPVRGAFESGIRKTYFSLVVSSGSEYEQFGLENLIQIVERGASEWEVELSNIEELVTKALRKVVRGFKSVPGALASRDKKAQITYYVTPATLPKHLEGLKDTVTKVADKLKKESGGRLEFKVIDPFEGQRAEAHMEISQKLYKTERIKAIPKDMLSEEIYHSWLTLKVGDAKDGFPLMSASKSLGEHDIKTEIEGALKRMIPGYLPLVAVVTPDPPFNPMMAQMGQRPPPSDFNTMQQFLEGDYEIRQVRFEGNDITIPRNAGVLLLVRPGEIPEAALYEIDQFVMRGGRLVVCADSFTFDASTTGQTGSISLSKIENSKFAELLQHYGVGLKPQMIVDERSDYLQMQNVRYIGGQAVAVFENVAYPFFARFEREAFNQNHPMTKGLDTGAFLWAAPLDLTKVPDGISATKLITSSKAAETRDNTTEVESILERGFQAGKDAKEQVLAAVVKGRFKSFFANRPIPGLDKPAETKPEEKKTEGDATKPPEGAEKPDRGAPLREAEREGTIVVFGDSDFLSTGAFRVLQLEPPLFQINVGLLKNALDYGGPDSNLLALRNRPPVRRPLSGLAGKSPEERASLGKWSMFWTGGLSLLAIVGAALGWYAYRGGRKPLELLPAESLGLPKGGAS